MTRNALLYDDDDAPKRRTRRAPLHPVAVPDLFAAPVLATPTRLLRGMVRGTDRLESQRAAVDVLPQVTALQSAVLDALRAEAMTDRELENLARFAHCGPSTIRKRRSECFQRGWVVDVGRRDKLTLWRAVAP